MKPIIVIAIFVLVIAFIVYGATNFKTSAISEDVKTIQLEKRVDNLNNRIDNLTRSYDYLAKRVQFQLEK